EVLGSLRRGAERMELSAPVMLVDAGILFTGDRAARYEHHGAFAWIALLRERGVLVVPAAQRDEFLAELLRQPKLPLLDLPEELRYQEVTLTPRPRLKIKPPDQRSWRPDQLAGELAFDYDN